MSAIQALAALSGRSQPSSGGIHTSRRSRVVFRRSFALMASIGLLAAACGGEPVSESTDAPTGQTSGPAAAEEPCLRAAFVFSSPSNIPGWEGAATDGITLVQEQLPCVETRSLENVTEGSEAERVFSDLAEEGFDVVFGHTFGYMDTMVEVSPNYPDTIFENGSGYKTTENMSNYFGAGWEGTYLAGIAAASVTTTKKLGWVGSFPVPDVLWDLNGFTLGARSVDPSITVQVVWTADWEDPVRDQQAAESLLDDGVDVIGQSSGSPSVGEVAEEQGVFWLPTLDKNQQPWGPTTMLAVRHYNWGAAFTDIIQQVIDGTWTNEPYFGSMSDDFVQLLELHPDVPADVVALIEQKRQEIIDGTLEIWAGPIQDNEGNIVVEEGSVASVDDLSAGTFLVDGVVGTIPAG
jgi:basic membrane protein A and related proteins